MALAGARSVSGARRVVRRVTSIRGTTTLVGLLGWPTAPLAVTADAERGLRRAGARLGLRPVADAARSLGEAVRGLVATGFAGANVTIPHKQAVIALLRRARRGRDRRGIGQHARRPGRPRPRLLDRRGRGHEPDRGARRERPDPRRGRRREGGEACGRRRRRGRDRAGHAAQSRLAAERRGSRRARQLHAGQGRGARPTAPGHAGRRPRVQRRRAETALVAAARAAGCETVVDGLDVLLAQGAAAFERWTGEAAPLVAMADALRRP